MYTVDRRSKEFIAGMHYFLSVANANKHKGFTCYPCKKVKKTKSSIGPVRLHNQFEQYYVFVTAVARAALLGSRTEPLNIKNYSCPLGFMLN